MALKWVVSLTFDHTHHSLNLGSWDIIYYNDICIYCAWKHNMLYHPLLKVNSILAQESRPPQSFQKHRSAFTKVFAIISNTKQSTTRFMINLFSRIPEKINVISKHFHQPLWFWFLFQLHVSVSDRKNKFGNFECLRYTSWCDWIPISMHWIMR